MEIKRYINTRMWSDTWFEELDTEEKLLWLYLLTNQQANLIGIYEIGIKRISNESGIEINRLQTVMERFENRYKAIHNGKFMVIPNFLKHQTLANPNMEKSARNIYNALPIEVIKLLQSIGIEDFQDLKEGVPNGLQTVRKPFANGSVSESEEEEEEEEEEEASQNSDFANSPKGSPPGNSDQHISDQAAAFRAEQSLDAQEKEKKKVAEKKKRRSAQFQMLEEVSLPFASKEFREIWETWLDYRVERKFPYASAQTMQAALHKCSQYSEEVAIHALKDSIGNSYQGFFPEKFVKDGKRTSKNNSGSSIQSLHNKIRSGSW